MSLSFACSTEAPHGPVLPPQDGLLLLAAGQHPVFHARAALRRLRDGDRGTLHVYLPGLVRCHVQPATVRFRRGFGLFPDPPWLLLLAGPGNRYDPPVMTSDREGTRTSEGNCAISFSFTQSPDFSRCSIWVILYVSSIPEVCSLSLRCRTSAGLYIAYVLIKYDGMCPHTRAGVLCTVVGVLVVILDCMLPKKMRKVFSLAMDEDEDEDEGDAISGAGGYLNSTFLRSSPPLEILSFTVSSAKSSIKSKMNDKIGKITEGFGK